MPSMGSHAVSLVVRARTNLAGRLIQADEGLLRLQQQAGGDLGDALLLPALARLAALAMRLETPIERPVLLADDAAEIRAFARILPDAEGARIELVEWSAQPLPDISADKALPPVPTRPIPPGLVRWACDVRLRLILVEADDAWDLSDTNWLGRPLSELFHLVPDRDGNFQILGALADQVGFTGQRARLASGKADGTILALSAHAMADEGSGFTGYYGSAEPIGFGQLPPELAAKRDADRGASLLGEMDTRNFALRVDGALRRPLGRIIANAETIAGQMQGPIRDEYARYASDIALAGRHLLDLVDDLADLQAVEREDFSVASEAVDLADVGRRAAGLLAMKAQERGIRIDAPDFDERALATGEFRRALQILLNLIGNAVRYSPDGSQIWLRVEEEAQFATITVADQGPGISAADQARLFEKFERLGRTDGGGAGLGLYISRRLALAMGGEIRIESAPGQGARFTLALPRRVTVTDPTSV